MRQQVLVSLLVVALVLAPLTPPVQAQGWQSLVPALAGKIIGLWRGGNLNILGHQCSYRVRPKIIRWRLWYKGTLACPGWTSITGSDKARNPNHVVTYTVTDFVKKAFEAGLIKESDAQRWLQ
uniref:Anti-LPS-factor-like-1 protein n=1 Tax=Pagurus bernhardus TaxID=174397 RepID=W6MEN5_PAGBR